MKCFILNKYSGSLVESRGFRPDTSKIQPAFQLFKDLFSVQPTLRFSPGLFSQAEANERSA